MSERFQRGFKAECEQLALETRAELGIKVGQPLPAAALAAHLSIPILSIEELAPFGASAKNIRTAQGAVSAFTVIRGSYRAIFYNAKHPASRLANSVAHELSHILLEHSPSVAVVDGRRAWDGKQEAEADWLAGTLLVPRNAALYWFKTGGSMAAGAAHFQVSGALFRWRVNQTGVARQLGLGA